MSTLADEDRATADVERMIELLESGTVRYYERAAEQRIGHVVRLGTGAYQRSDRDSVGGCGEWPGVAALPPVGAVER